MKCKENTLGKVKNGLKNAFGPSTAYDVAGLFRAIPRPTRSRFFAFFHVFEANWGLLTSPNKNIYLPTRESLGILPWKTTYNRHTKYAKTWLLSQMSRLAKNRVNFYWTIVRSDGTEKRP